MLPSRNARSPLFKFVLVFICIALLAGGALIWLRPNDAPPPPITEHSFENGNIIWTIDAYPAKVLQRNSFKIDVTDRNGSPVKDASIHVKLDMLNMVCGDYQFEMAEAAPGKYEGEGIPLMAGTWKATLTLEMDDHSYTVVRLLRAVH